MLLYVTLCDAIDIARQSRETVRDGEFAVQETKRNPGVDCRNAASRKTWRSS